jgi:mannitol/fructose-specific phosphotransferase system IIA component (Ntr-type)
MTSGTAPSIFDPSLYIPDLKLKKKESALGELVDLACRAGAVRSPILLLELLGLRERLGSTAVGKGVAIPNARSLTVQRPLLVVARIPRGIEWDAPDAAPVSLVLLVLSPGEWSVDAHHGFVGRAAAVARMQRNRQRLLEAPNFEDVAGILHEVTA